MPKLIWVVPAVLKDLRDFPDKPRQEVGHALSQAEFGRVAASAKAYKGYAQDGVFEIVAEDTSTTYRALYATKIDDDIYVLHCFNKKSPRGKQVPKPAKTAIDARLKKAKKIAAERAAETAATAKTKTQTGKKDEQ